MLEERAMRFAVSLAALVVLGACGGKVLYENGPEVTPSPTTPEPPPVATEEPAPPPTPKKAPKQEVSIEIACTRWCENNTQCGKHTMNCVQDCLDDAASSCSSKEWVVCAANQEEKRCALPSDCEQAYCSWAKCAHRPLPDYCE